MHQLLIIGAYCDSPQTLKRNENEQIVLRALMGRIAIVCNILDSMSNSECILLNGLKRHARNVSIQFKGSYCEMCPHSYLSRDKSQTIFNFESTAFTYSGPVCLCQSFLCSLSFLDRRNSCMDNFEKRALIDKHN